MSGTGNGCLTKEVANMAVSGGGRILDEALSNDYEELTETSESMIYLAMIIQRRPR